MSGKKGTTPIQNVFNALKSKSTYNPIAASKGATGISSEEMASSAFQSGLGSSISEMIMTTPQEKAIEDQRQREMQVKVQEQQKAFADEKTKEIKKTTEQQNSIKQQIKALEETDPFSKEIKKLTSDPKNYIKQDNPFIPTNATALGQLNFQPLVGELNPEVKAKVEELRLGEIKNKAPLLENFTKLKKQAQEQSTALMQTQAYLQKVKRIEDLEGKASIYGKNFSEAKSDYEKQIENTYGKTGIMGFIGKLYGGVTKSINDLTYSGLHAASSPEEKMSKKDKEEYFNLKEQVKAIQRPYLEKSIEDLENLKQESSNIFNSNKTSWGSAEEKHKTYSMMAMDRAIEEAKSALNGDSGASIFFRELSKLTYGKNGLMEDAQRSLNEYWRYDDLVKKEAKLGSKNLSPVEQESLKLYTRAQELEGVVAEQQSFGYKTVKGTMGSVGFIRDIWLGARVGKAVGSLFGLTKAQAGVKVASKLLGRGTVTLGEEGAQVGSKLFRSGVGNTATRIAIGTGKEAIKFRLPGAARMVAGATQASLWGLEQAAITYLDPKSINARKNKGAEFVTNEKGDITDFLTREELYKTKQFGSNKETIRLTGIKKMLEGQENLSEEDKLALKQVKARLGETEMEGITSIQDELSQYEVESGVKANLKGIGDTSIETLSELYTGKLMKGIGKGVKMLPRAKGLITSLEGVTGNATRRFYNTGVGRGYRNWQGLVGKLNINDTKVVGSIFEEQIEEYTAAIGHSLFDWSMDDINQTFSTDGARDIASQTMLMNGMFGVGGNVQLHTKLRYNSLYSSRLERMNKRVAELEKFVKENPNDADGKKGLEDYKAQVKAVQDKSSLGLFDPTRLISGDKTGFSATRNYIDNRKEIRSTIDALRFASNDADINTAVDVASLSTLGAADKENEALILELKGKKAEAAHIRKSMFKDIVFKAFSTNTHEELEAGLKSTLNNKNISDEKKAQLKKMHEAVVELRELKEKYAETGAKNADQAVALTYNIITKKDEIEETRGALAKNGEKAKEIIDAYIQSKGITGIDYTPATLLSREDEEFTTPEERKKYEDFIEELQALEEPSVVAQFNGLNQISKLEKGITSDLMTRTELLHPSMEVKNGRAMIEELHKEAQSLFKDKENNLKLKSVEYDEEGELIQTRELIEEMYDTISEKWIGKAMDGKISRATFETLKNRALQKHDEYEEYIKETKGRATTNTLAAAEENKSEALVPPDGKVVSNEEIVQLPLTDGIAQQNFEDIVQSSPIFNMPVPELPNFDSDEAPDPLLPGEKGLGIFTFNIAEDVVIPKGNAEVEELREKERVENAAIEKRKQDELAKVKKSRKVADFISQYELSGYGDFTDPDFNEQIKRLASEKIIAKYETELAEVYDKYDKLITPLLNKQGPQDTGDVFVVPQDDFEDFMLGPKTQYTAEDAAVLKEFVESVAAPIALVTGQDVSLTMAFEQFFRTTDRKEDLVKRLPHFINGWVMNGFEIKEGEILNLANKFGALSKRVEQEQSFFDRFGETIPNIFTQPLGVTQTIGLNATIENSIEVNAEMLPKEEPTFYEENAVTPTVKSGIEDAKEEKTSSVKPKVGFSAMAHENVVLPNGVVVKRTVGDFLNIIAGHPLGLDFRPLLHPDNGPTMTLGIQKVDESKWGQVPVPIGLDERGMPILDENGQTKLVSFAQWVSLNKSNPNFEVMFSNKVPYVFTHKGTVVGFVHETDWYNPSNVSHPFAQDMTVNEMDEEWAAHIQAGKDATTTLRNNIAAGLTEVTATVPVNMLYHTLAENENLITARESNPQSIVAVQIGVDGSLEGLDKGFQTGDKVLLNSLEGPDALNAATSGHTCIVHRVGTQINPTTGKRIETYRAVKVNRFFTPAQMESIQWAIAAHKVLDGKTVSQEFGLTKEDAEEIRKDIRATMGLNISKSNDLATYIQHFVKLTQGALANFNSDPNRTYKAKDVTDKLAYMNILFEQNLTYDQLLQLVEQNTAKRGLISNSKIALISQGKVQVYKTAEGKEGSYHDYLMDTIYTNIKTFDMDSTGTNPTFVLGIQPVISLDYTPKVSAVQQNTVQAKAEIAAQAVLAEQAQEEAEVFDTEAAEKYLSSIGVNLEDFELEDFHIGDLSKISDLFQLTPGLSVAEERPIKEEIAHQVITKLGFRSKVSNETKEKIKESVKADIVSQLNAYTKTLNTLLDKAKLEKTPSEKVRLIQKALALTKINIENLVENFDSVYEKALAEVNIQTKIDLKSVEYQDEEDDTQSEKNYSKDSVEESLKSKASERLRMLFSGIPQFDGKGEVIKGYLGFRRFMSLNDVYNQVLKNISFGIDSDSDFNSLIKRLSESPSPAMQEVVKRLKESDIQIQNEFVYNVVAHTLSSKFAMYEELENGFSLKMYDTNANEITRVLKNIWRENAVASDLYNYDGSINEEYARALLDEFKSLPADLNQVSGEVLRNWLSKLGIELNDNTWEEIYTGKLYYQNKFQSMETLYKQKKGGIFKPLASFLENALDPKKSQDYSADGKYNILSDLGGLSTAIANVEAKYNPQLVALSFRDTGKNINTQVPPKFVTDKVAELLKDARGSQEKIKALQSISFSQDSLILDQLLKNPEVAENFRIHHSAITALKERGSKVFGKNEITSLGEIEYDMVTTTGFSDRRVAKLPDHVKVNGFSMRMANMLFPTMSDKSTGLFLTTPIFDFLKDAQDSFVIAEDGKVSSISNEVKETLFQFLVLPEIKRIHNFYKNVKATNIKGYDKAVDMFHLLPIMNTLTNSDNVPLKDILKNNAEVAELDVFLEQYGDIFKSAIEGVIRKEVDHKISQWEVAKEETKDKKIVSKLFGTEYFTAEGVEMDPEKHYEAGVWDYVMNSMIFNAEVFKVFAGDVALFSQDKLFKNEIKDSSEYISINKQIGVNLGKRLALLIAPGKKISNSMTEKYNQVILKDSVDIAENASTLIEMYYSKEEADKAAPLLKRYNNLNRNLDRLQKISLWNKSIEQVDRYHAMQEMLEKELKDIRSKLADDYKSIDAYFDIESTDAQEYTTITEHLNILQRLGRITPEDEKDILNQLFANEDLTKEQLSLVMQPIKPVHTGTYINKALDVNRTVYVKSSAFPLIPQLTRGTKLNNLRVALEELEGVTGRFTRASYQTANKVGSVVDENAINPLDVNDLQKMYVGLNLQSKDKEYDLANVSSSVLVLDRNNFRIQQDVPFKSDKKKRDEVAMGTQIFKLLFGDGVSDSKNFNFKGEPTTGKELYEIYNSSFAKIVNVKKTELFRELGLSNEGKIVDEEVFVTNLQKLLEKEAIDRGYSIKSIRGLKMDKLVSAATGETYYDFKTPLWLSPDSNRYESLLNSIVTNRVMRHKMPGNGYVAGSEHGFQFKESLEDIDKNRTIFFDNWNGKELQGVHTTEEDGTPVFQKAQVLAPSKFKDINNKLIDLYEGYNAKTGDVSKAKYLKRNANGSLGLKEGMLDTELLNLFSFRTPTSSHVSGSSIEIVGILPPECGDLMIVPKNFTKQKGLDYDIDKESGYQLNHVQNLKTGKIEVLNQEHLEQELEVFNNKLAKLDLENAVFDLKGKKFKFEEAIKDPKASIFDMKNSLLERFAAILEDSASQEDIDILLDPTTSIRQKIEAKKSQLEKKLAENDFIRVHLAVYNSPDVEIQKKINKVLSMKFAQDQAKAIEKLTEQGTRAAFITKYREKNPKISPKQAAKAYEEDFKNSTILGYSYQKAKMNLGSVGKTAIGVYANYTTFNGLINQTFGEEGMPIFNPKTGELKSMTIGNFTSMSLGQRQSLAPSDEKLKAKWEQNKHQRESSETWGEKENTATDNEKEQILGRVGVNDENINTESLTTLRGFDKDENGNSIPYLLMSQPVIKDYINTSKSVKGLLGTYTSKEDLINSILQDLSNNQYTYEINPETFEYEFVDNGNPIMWEGSESLTGDNLLKGIKENGKDKDIQLKAFMTYLELQKEAIAVSAAQKVVNTNTLGKSMVESISRQESLSSLANSKMFPQAIKLLGEVAEKPFTGYYPFTYTSQTKEGPVVKTMYIKPTTPQGHIVINGLYIGSTLFKDFFPYKEKSIKKIISEIGVSENENTKIEEIETILEEIKKYLYSNPNLGVFEGDINAKREDLFVDSPSNVSLARYMMTTLRTVDKNHIKGLKSIKNNALLQRFIYEVGKGKDKVSVIKYNNSATDNLDEESLYNSLPELIENNFSLPPRNGKPYSTTDLAKDLAAYSFLEGGVQEATQFVKFVPVELLEAMGRIGKSGNFISIASNLKAYNPKRNTNADLFEGFLGIKEESVGGVSTFTRQFFQHFPQRTDKIAFKDRQNLTDNGSKFSLSLEQYPSPPNFVHVKAKGVIRLYSHVGNNKYQEIEILSGKGISQYQYKIDNAKSLKQADIKPLTPELVTPTYTVGKLTVRPTSTIKSVITDISKLELPSNYAHIPYLAKWLSDMVKDTGALHVIDKAQMTGSAATGATSLYIKLSTALFEKGIGVEKTAEIFMHEFVHHVSIHELAKYYEEDFKTLKPGNVPAHVQTLDIVFKAFAENLDATKLEKFKKLDEIVRNEAYTPEERRAAALERDAYEERDIYYAGINIKEFLAMALTDRAIQEKLSSMPYLKSGKSFMEKIQDLIVRLFSEIYPAIKEDTLAMDALKASMNFIQEEYNSRPKNSVSLPQVNPDPVIPDNIVFKQPEPDFIPEFSNQPEPFGLPDVDADGRIISLPGVSFNFNIKPKEQEGPNYNEVYNSDINKGKKDYFVTRKKVGVNQYANIYAKKVVIPGFENFEFVIYLDNSKRYYIMEKQTGMDLPNKEGKSTIKDTLAGVQKLLETQGPEKLAEIISKTPKVYKEKEDNALPLGISQMEWEGLTIEEKQKIKECN